MWVSIDSAIVHPRIELKAAKYHPLGVASHYNFGNVSKEWLDMEEESATLVALAVEGDCVLDFCSYDRHRKTRMALL